MHMSEEEKIFISDMCIFSSSIIKFFSVRKLWLMIHFKHHHHKFYKLDSLQEAQNGFGLIISENILPLTKRKMSFRDIKQLAHKNHESQS
jgi:hypothetical protein